MRLSNFIEELYKAGWRSTCDAQHGEIKKLHAKLFPVISELEEELNSSQETIREFEKGENL